MIREGMQEAIAPSQDWRPQSLLARRPPWLSPRLRAAVLAVVLLAQVVYSIRDAAPPLPSDRAINTRDVITATITLPPAAYATAQEARADTSVDAEALSRPDPEKMARHMRRVRIARKVKVSKKPGWLHRLRHPV